MQACKDDHTMSWNAALSLFATGYVIGGLSVLLVLGLLWALRRARR
jgi:hypothetical protein